MKYFLLNSYWLVSFMLLLSCQPSPQEIHYGEMGCSYCQMTIVDKQYAAQLVTSTGKNFSFDAVECLLHYREEHTDVDWAYQLVSDYQNPGKLIPLKESVFVRSEKLPSPMGMYLTAVADSNAAREITEKHGGTIYSYPELQKQWGELPAL